MRSSLPDAYILSAYTHNDVGSLWLSASNGKIHFSVLYDSSILYSNDYVDLSISSRLLQIRGSKYMYTRTIWIFVGFTDRVETRQSFQTLYLLYVVRLDIIKF